MKRHILLTLICLLFTCATIFAQNSEPRKGTAYVKGGYEIIGIIIEHQNGDITIKADNGEQFEFTKKEIRKIKYPKEKKIKKEASVLAPNSKIDTRKPNPEEFTSSNNRHEYTSNSKLIHKQNKSTKRREKEEKSSQKQFSFDREGYMRIIENNFGGGNCSVPNPTWMSNQGFETGIFFDYKCYFINGYQTKSAFFIGLGFGINAHNDKLVIGDKAYIPIFIHIRKSSPRKKVSPYFGLSLGYNIGKYSVPMAEASFGLQAKFRKKGAFWIGPYVEYADDFKNILQESHYYITGGLKIGFSF